MKSIHFLKLSALFLFLSSAVSTFSQTSANSYPLASQQGLEVLRNQGLDPYIRFWRDHPEKALDLRAWCTQEIAANGKIVKIPFEIHPTALEVVEAVNHLNKEMGFDCYQIEPVYDVNPKDKDTWEHSNYNQIDHPTQKTERIYKIVRNTRAALVPLLGYFITAVPIWNGLNGDFSGSSFAKHGGEFMQANMKAFLEFQFAYFTAQWTTYFFGTKYFHTFKETSKSFFGKAARSMLIPFNMLAKGANKLLDKTGNNIRASHFWISMVNLVGYPFAMGVALSFGEHLFGQVPSEGFQQSLTSMLSEGLHMIKSQFAMSMAFNFTFMFFQDRTGAARNQNLWSETNRLFAESIPVLLFNTFRGISAIYAHELGNESSKILEYSMVASQLAIGGVLSAWIAAKVNGAKLFARETGLILSKMEENLKPEDKKLVIKLIKAGEESLATSKTQGKLRCDQHLSWWANSQARIFEFFQKGFKSDALKAKSP